MKTGHKRGLLILFFALLAAGGISLYTKNIISKLPDELYIYNNRETTVELSIPVTGVIRETGQNVNFSKPVTFQAGQKGEYSLEYKLFNLISLPSGRLSVLDDDYVYAGGFPAGMYLKTEGVLVVDTAEFTTVDGQTAAPAAGIFKSNDYILKINGTEILKKNDIAAILADSDGSELTIEFVRDGQTLVTSVSPVKNVSGEYKLGIWVKDDEQGIGTVTYIDKSGNFGALGHGMSDSATGELLKVSNGFLYRTDIISVTQAHDGTPGEYVGTIDYANSNRLGLISANRKNGIYGTLPASKCDELINQMNLTAYEVGVSHEVSKGKAQILIYLDGTLESYDIEIEEISYRDEKSITFKVTSKELMNLTNGIVRGMSGSPIVQNGKLIGAVTHVFVNDSSRGYGIFIENMLEAD